MIIECADDREKREREPKLGELVVHTRKKKKLRVFTFSFL